MACPFDGPMIHADIENKYSFNMQVSVKAMATPDRDHCDLKTQVVQLLRAIGPRYGHIFSPY